MTDKPQSTQSPADIVTDASPQTDGSRHKQGEILLICDDQKDNASHDESPFGCPCCILPWSR